MELERIGVTAIIAASPTIMMCAKQYAPKLEVHVSTQHSSTNASAANYWKRKGMDRVVLARELTLKEIQETAKHAQVPLEEMCIRDRIKDCQITSSQFRLDLFFSNDL